MKISDGYKSLRHIAATLSPGESRNGLRCPFCGGGSGGESSLSISRKSEAEALFICFRASCSRAGRIACYGFRLTQHTDSSSTEESRRASSNLFTPRIYSYDTRDVGEEWVSYLLRRFDLSRDELTREGWRESVANGELVIPIRNHLQIRTGTEARKFPLRGTPDAGPKVRLYREMDGCFQNWFGIGKSGPTVAVEDSISALKVSRSFKVAALLGTHLSFEKLSEMLDMGPEIVIALDRDATSKAFAYQKKFGIYGRIRVAVLEQDLKYESDERIKEIIDAAVE